MKLRVCAVLNEKSECPTTLDELARNTNRLAEELEAKGATIRSFMRIGPHRNQILIKYIDND